jgi:hypothetical protein
MSLCVCGRDHIKRQKLMEFYLLFFSLAYNMRQAKIHYFYAYFSIIKEIFDVVDKHTEDGTLIKDLSMRSLPALSKKFVDLLELLV